MSSSRLHRLRSAALIAAALAAYAVVIAILLAAAVHAEVPTGQTCNRAVTYDAGSTNGATQLVAAGGGRRAAASGPLSEENRTEQCLWRHVARRHLSEL